MKVGDTVTPDEELASYWPSYLTSKKKYTVVKVRGHEIGIIANIGGLVYWRKSRFIKYNIKDILIETLKVT